MVRVVRMVLGLVVAAFGSTTYVSAQESALQDRNGDGVIELLAFGDSITYGVGDGIEPGAYISTIGEMGPPRGWPQRLSYSLGVAVLNAGVPGDQIVGEPGGREPGVERFPRVVVGSGVDTVIIKEGANDAFRSNPVTAVERNLQKMINVARADNKSVVLVTLAPPTVQHAAMTPLTMLYSAVIKQLGDLNSLQVVDIEAMFLADCPELSTCKYYNLPEGLHPNTAGYDAIAQKFATSLQ